MPSSSTMKSSSIADYILKLDKLNDESHDEPNDKSNDESNIKDQCRQLRLL